MAAAEGEGPPPAELRMAWRCQKWHTLPEDGGLNDQDARLMHLMTVTDNVYTVVARFRSMTEANPENVHKLSNDDRRMIGWLHRQGYI